MDLLTQEHYKKAINYLGVNNYMLFGEPTGPEDFFELFKPVKGVDEAGSVVFYDAEEYPISYEQLSTTVLAVRTEYANLEYQRQRAAEYPDFKDYLDGIVKGDQTQIQAYIDACLAVKEKYPKPGAGS